MSQADANGPTSRLAPTVTLSPGLNLSGWWTLLAVSLRQLTRGRRLLALASVFAIPGILAVVMRHEVPDYPRKIARIEDTLLLYMIPQALVPLAALILASGMIRDEVEGQTLTYILTRPLRRSMVYVAKVIAAWLVSAALALVFTTLTALILHWGVSVQPLAEVVARALRISGLSALALTVYVTLFGLVGLVLRWVLPMGVAYTILFEGLFANIDFSIRRITVLWYTRILAERWFGVHVDAWSIDLETAPSGTEALLTLLLAALVFATIGAALFSAREIRMKTPEGS